MLSGDEGSVKAKRSDGVNNGPEQGRLARGESGLFFRSDNSNELRRHSRVCEVAASPPRRHRRASHPQAHRQRGDLWRRRPRTQYMSASKASRDFESMRPRRLGNWHLRQISTWRGRPWDSGVNLGRQCHLASAIWAEFAPLIVPSASVPPSFRV